MSRRYIPYYIRTCIPITNEISDNNVVQYNIIVHCNTPPKSFRSAPTYRIILLYYYYYSRVMTHAHTHAHESK